MNPTVALIPSAYKSGTVYSVMPAFGKGDFNFNRPSSATRVNPDGLVEEMPILRGNNLITNGTFDTDLSGWTIQGGASNWVWDNGSALMNVTGGSQALIQDFGGNNTTIYEVKVDATKTGTKNCRVLDASGSSLFLSNGSNTFVTTLLGGNLYFKPSNENGTGEIRIDNVTVNTYIANVPRLDYTNGNCPQLLLEPQSSNLALYSGDLTNAEWQPFGNVVVTGGYIAPDGTNSAVKVSCDNIVSNSVLIQQSIGNSTRSRTIYARTVKTGTTGIANLCSYYNNNNNEFTITDQWQRFEVNGTSTATGQSDFYAIDFRGTTDLEEILLWGGQIEDLAYATSYIPTESTTVTRSRDLMTESMFYQSEITSNDWTLFLDYNKSDLGDNRGVSINNGGSNNRILITQRNRNQLNFQLYQSGSILSSYDYDIELIDHLKVCFTSTNTGASIVVNGVEIDRLDDGRYDASSLTQIDFTVYGTTNAFAGRVNEFRYYNVALSLNETIALTQ